MGQKLLVIIKWSLLIWGGLSLFGTLGLFALIFFNITIGNRAKIDCASANDVRFVLNWCNLGANRIEEVLHSYVSSRSFFGDHLDAYAIKIRNVTVAELTADKDKGNFTGRWYRGDQLPPVLDDAVAFIGGWIKDSKDVSWFPKESELRSGDIYICPWSIDCHGVSPTAAELIFVRPKDKMVFFFGGKI